MRERQYAGADWVKSAMRVEDMSPLGEAVANLLGDAWQGIYHLTMRYLSAVDWSHPHHIIVVVNDGLSTFDSNLLTILVVLCHDRALRMEINVRWRGRLELVFHQRQRDGEYWQRHPTIEQHITTIRAHYDKTGVAA